MSIDKKLESWIVQETNGLCEGKYKNIPESELLAKLSSGKNKKLWLKIIAKVKARHTIQRRKRILHVNRAEKELSNLYPSTLKHDVLILRKRIEKFENKCQFICNSLKRVKERIIKLQKEIRDIEKDNALIMQRCTFLELIYLKCEQKSDNLKENERKLNKLCNVTFEMERKKCVEDYVYPSNKEDDKFKPQLIEILIKNITLQISPLGEGKLSNEIELMVINKWIEAVIDVMKTSSINDFVTVFKGLSKMSEITLKENDSFVTSTTNQMHEKNMSFYYKCLQDMKHSLVESTFHRIKINNSIAGLEVPKEFTFALKSGTSKSDITEEYISIKLKNEYLKTSIIYLEDILSKELQKSNFFVKKNNILKSQCDNLKHISRQFYKIYKFLHTFANTFLQTVFDVSNLLITCNGFLCRLSKAVRNEDLSFDIFNLMLDDYDTSLKSIKSSCLLNDLLYNIDFENADIPQHLWEQISLETFNNWHLICNRLMYIKRILSVPRNNFKSQIEQYNIEESDYIMDHLERLLKDLKSAEEKTDCKTRNKLIDLKDVVDEWWTQKAQYIIPINYDGKSLKMWIDILAILNDF